MARIPYSPKAAVAPVLDRRASSSAAKGTATSGAQPLGVASLRATLRRYISPILLDSVLNRAIQTHAPAKLPPNELLKLVAADCMIGLRLFVSPALLPDLMLELAELLEQAD